MAAANPQFKVNQIAKDLGIKSKEIIDFLAEKGINVKTQSALEPKEFDPFLENITKKNQIKDIDAYIDGDTYIPSKLVKEEKPVETAPTLEEKPMPKVEEKPKVVEKPKAEVKEAPKAEVKEEPKAEVKPEIKEMPKKEERPASTATAAAQSTAKAPSAKAY